MVQSMTWNWTPGPWAVKDMHGAEYDACRFENGAFGVFSPDCDHHMVADVSCNHSCRGEEECRANAYLIAAAPDMYEALEALLEVYVTLAASGDCGNWDPEETPHVISARVALAKARGET